jgi:hypothetical protein
MIRQLAQCPYCQGCEVALTDSFDVILNPDSSSQQACPHLIRVAGRYSQWGLSSMPGRKTKIARMVGSNEFDWQHPDLPLREDGESLQPYLKDLVESGAGWEFAPSEEHLVRTISLDQKITEADGREYPQWEIEGTALLARDAAAFLASLPACQTRQSAAWSDLPGSSAGEFDFT